MTANDQRVIKYILNYAYYQTNDVDHLQRLMTHTYHCLFGRRGYSLRTIIMVGRSR